MISSRRDDVLQKTKERLEQHFPNIFEEVICTYSFETEEVIPKSEICRQLQVDIMIEDDLFHASDVASVGIPCFLLAKPRNSQYDPKTHPGIIKVNSRNEIDLSLIS